MSERLEAEVQINEAAPEAAVVEGLDGLDEAVEASRLTPAVAALIDRMLDGTEPLGRELKPYEMLKFNPTHINICALRVAGFKGSEIGRMLGKDRHQVWIILHHPYGRKLVRALSGTAVGHVIDIRTRLDEYASELLDHTFALTMQTNDAEQVSKVTFGLLDRAGYSPKQPPQSGEKPLGVYDAPSMARLASALEGSQSIDAHVMRSFVPRRPPDEGALVESEAVGSSASELDDSVPSSFGSQPVAPRRVG